VECINDISGDIANFFRVLQEHYAYLVDMLRFRVTSRAEFNRLLALPADRLTDLRRAVRFLYLQRLSFGGKVAGRSFGVDARSPARFNAGTIESMLGDIHERLEAVIIEQLGYGDFIRRYDTAETLFYLDPPYWGCEQDYGQDVFGRADFAAIAAQLSGLRGRFLVSINDTPGVRECFAGFMMREVETTYTIGAAKPKRARELLISNFEFG
jgi:DNA adenine methylase